MKTADPLLRESRMDSAKNLRMLGKIAARKAGNQAK